MSYQCSFNDLLYPQVDRTPGIARYRIVSFDDGFAMRAVVHIVRFVDTVPAAPAIDVAIDAALNKIIDAHFLGIRIDRVHLVVESSDGVFEYPIEFDATEFYKRGNSSALQGSGKSQAVSIDSKDVVGGSVSFFALSAKRHAMSAVVENALR